MSAAGLASGTVFARDYRIVAPLGHGGMGSLYVAEQISTAKRRALKLMHPTLIPSAEHRERFIREAQVGSRIASEHVVEVTAAGVDEESGMPYLAMELLEGETFDAYVKRRGFLPVDELMAVFQQLCHAMIAAHAAGVVHRDLKPENVFLAVSRRAGGLPYVVKVLDFGIAKLAAEAGTRGTTGAMGSPLWMAPEQTERGGITAAADVWALGLMAYFALTGTVFWRSARDPQTTIAQVLREIVLEPIPAATVRANEAGVVERVPPGFDRFFARAVAREPRARMQDASGFWNELSTMSDATSATISSNQAFTPRPQTPAPVTPQPVSPAPYTPPHPGLGTAPSVAHTLAPQSSAGPWIFASAMVLAVAVFASVAFFIVRMSGHRTAGSESVTVTRTVDPVPPASVASVPAPQPAPSALPQIVAVAAPPPVTATVVPKTTAAAPPPVTTAEESHPPATASDIYGPSSSPGRTWKVGGHTIRVVPGHVHVSGNVSAAVVRDAIDWDSWQYLHSCYDKQFSTATSLPKGTVTISFQVFDQLPRKGTIVHSDFMNAAFSQCVLNVAMGQTVNAAGADGFATATYELVFTVVD